MKLNEITPSGLKRAATGDIPYKELIELSVAAESIRKYLLSKGFKEIGEGGFSLVYGNDESNIVVKVIDYEDPGYNMFVNYAIQNKNKHLPRIAKPIPYETRTGTNYIYVMEKLKPLNTRFNKEYLIKFCIAVRHFRAFLNKNFRYEMVPAGLDTTWKEIFKEHRSLFYELQKIKRYFKGKFDIDTHCENFMVRSETGTVVIIDPVSFLYKGNK